MTTHPHRHLLWVAAVSAACCTAATACGAPAPDGALALPALDVVTEIDDLDHPWDVVAAPDGTLLTGERSGRFVVKHPDGSTAVLAADLPTSSSTTNWA